MCRRKGPVVILSLFRNSDRIETSNLRSKSAWQNMLLRTLKMGPARVAQRILQHLVPPWLFDTNRLTISELKITEWRGAKPDSKWNFRWATRDDTDLLMSRGLSRTEIDEFFAHGARGSILESDGELITNGWVIPNRWVCFDWIEFQLEPGELYGASGYVAPAHRGQRIHQQSRNFIFGNLAEEGYLRSVTLIESLNRSSLRADANKSRHYHGHLGYVRFLGVVTFRLNGIWRVGFWNRRQPFPMSYSMFNPDAMPAQTDSG